MNYEEYKKEINDSEFEGVGKKTFLKKLLKQLGNDDELTDDEKLALELQIRDILGKTALEEKKQQELLKSEETEDINNSPFPKYFLQLGEEDGLEDGVKIFGGYGVPYGIWLRDVYLPTFHPLPAPEIQYPVAVCLMLINCNAVTKSSQKIPLGYFLGRRGSGKTELAKAMLDQYPPNLGLEVRPNATGAGIRDVLDLAFCGRDPGLVIFDNFNPRKSLDRLGAFYDLLLANCAEQSISRLSSTGSEGTRKSEYYTYSHKILTSVFDLAAEAIDEAKEIDDRCIYVCFKQADTLENRLNYSWHGLRDRFLSLWGHEALEQVHTTYRNLLAQLISKKPSEQPIKGRAWENSIIPIAVGTYAGIFKNIDEGIDHFSKYYEWLPTGKGNHVKDPLVIIVTDYITKELPKMIKEMPDNPYRHPDDVISLNLIKRSDVKRHIESVSGFVVGKKDLDSIDFLMIEFGYAVVKIGRDMVYKKD